jgi:hypothetical protein
MKALHDRSTRTAVAVQAAPLPLLVRVTSPEDRAAIERAVDGRAPVHFCASSREIVARVHAGIAGVVLELGADAGRELPSIVAALEGLSIPLLLRFTLRGNRALQQLLDHHHRVTNLRTSLRELDSLAEDVATLLARRWAERARLPILARVRPIVPGPAQRIVTAAVATGWRAVTVPELAALSGQAVRTLDARCRAAGVLPPRPLLGWMLALHATWRVTRWEWSAPEVAHAAGLESVKALADRLERATGLRLRACVDLGFEHLLERFAIALPIGGARRELERDRAG